VDDGTAVPGGGAGAGPPNVNKKIYGKDRQERTLLIIRELVSMLVA